MLIKGKVYVDELYAGIIQQNEDGFNFIYDKEYLKGERATSISLTLPLSEKPYFSKVLFPFFDGLIPEGWLLEIVQNNWKLDGKDRMSLLLTVCNDCIGNVSIIADEDRSDD